MYPTYPFALVTGGAHRLGRAFALALARMGFAIGLHYYRSADQAAQTVAEIRGLGVPAFPFQADLTNLSDIENLFVSIDRLFAEFESPLSAFRVLVNSAAIMFRGDALTLAPDDFDSSLALNLRAPFLCAQQAARRMTAGGLIVNISDVGASKTWTGFPAYTVSKAGVESLTKILARSFAPQVRVNAIAPGLVLPSDDMPAEDWQRLVARLPLRRSAVPEEIAATLEFLIKNEYITGQTITVDGGYSLL